jgi:hypothetical protein
MQDAQERPTLASLMLWWSNTVATSAVLVYLVLFERPHSLFGRICCVLLQKRRYQIAGKFELQRGQHEGRPARCTKTVGRLL